MTLNGQAVPIITTVHFVLGVELTLGMDESGKIWDGSAELSRGQLVERARSLGKDILVRTNGRVRHKYVFETMQFLKAEGVENVFFLHYSEKSKNRLY